MEQQQLKMDLQAWAEEAWEQTLRTTHEVKQRTLIASRDFRNQARIVSRDLKEQYIDNIQW